MAGNWFLATGCMSDCGGGEGEQWRASYQLPAEAAEAKKAQKEVGPRDRQEASQSASAGATASDCNRAAACVRQERERESGECSPPPARAWGRADRARERQSCALSSPNEPTRQRDGKEPGE